MSLIFSGASNVGMKRKSNQDSIYMNPKVNVFLVADGMGGHNGGDIASQMAVKLVPEFLLQNLDTDPTSTLINSIKYANLAIFNRAKEDSLLKGMGTTIVGLYLKGKTVYIPNVGDSRAYLINKKRLFQLSRDHSLVQEKLNLAIYTRDEAAKDPMKNVLIRTVGYEEDVNADVYTYNVSRGDILYICSDGLHGKVSDRDVISIINDKIPDPLEISQDKLDLLVKTLIGQANANGGQDNISLIMVTAI